MVSGLRQALCLWQGVAQTEPIADKVTLCSIKFANRLDSRHSRFSSNFSHLYNDTVVPMLKRFAPLVPLTLALFLAACASTSHQAQQPQQSFSSPSQQLSFELDAAAAAKAEESSVEQQLLDGKPYELPSMHAILERGFALIGTRYRPGGSSTSTGFDCSGFIGYLFREEAGIKLPRSTREMINIPAPKVARHDLQPGDLIFFATSGRGRVNHAGIYIGEGEFIHSSSTRSGGVRVDKLASSYWNSRYLMAKRVIDK